MGGWEGAYDTRPFGCKRPRSVCHLWGFRGFGVSGFRVQGHSGSVGVLGPGSSLRV